MKLLSTFFLVAILSFSHTYSQTWPKLSWYKTYDGPSKGVDIVQDIVFDDQNNLYLAGRSGGSDLSQDLLIIKYSAKGDSLLEIRYTPNLHSWDEAVSIALDSNKNIYVVGSSTFNQSSSYAIFHKYTPQGELVFEKNFNNDTEIYSEGAKIVLNSNEEPVIGYNKWYNGSSAMIAKYSPLGDSLWTTNIADDTSDYFVNDLVVDQSDNLFACLTQQYWDGGDTPSSKAVLAKINSAGEILWKTSIIGEAPRKILLDKDQNVVMISHGDGRTIKFNSEGEILWINDYSNSAYPIQILTDIVIDSKNNIIVTGYEVGVSSWDYKTKKITPDGVEIWAKWFESLEGLNDFASGIAIDEQDNLYVTGSSHNQVSIGICYTVTYPADGSSGWVFKFDPPNSTFEKAYQLFVGDSNHIYIGGDIGEPGMGPDFLAFKIDYGLGNDVKLIDNNIPRNFSLSQNYPNPFNPTTHFRFRIANFGFVSLEIYDVLGNEVATLVNGEKEPGTYEVEFNASQLSSGIYFYKLQTEGFSSTKKMILLR